MDGDRHRGMKDTALRAVVLTPPEQEPRELLASVGRALHALEEIAAAPGPLPAKAVAQKLGISLGTSYRVLHTLEHEGYVVRLGHGCFGLGGKVPALARRFQERVDVVPGVRSALKTLADEAGEDVYLAVFHAGEIAVVEVIEGSRELHVDGLDVGFSGIAHTTAIGKVLLAACPDEVIDDFLSERRLRAFTPRTLVRRRHVKRHLRAVRELGLGRDLEELAAGCCCVAAPVVDASGETVASVGLSTTAERWREESEALTRACLDAAARASGALAPG